MRSADVPAPQNTTRIQQELRRELEEDDPLSVVQTIRSAGLVQELSDIRELCISAVGVVGSREIGVRWDVDVRWACLRDNTLCVEFDRVAPFREIGTRKGGQVVDEMNKTV